MKINYPFSFNNRGKTHDVLYLAAALMLFPSPLFSQPVKERLPVPVIPKISYAVAVNADWMEICLLNNKYDTNNVKNLNYFSITSSDDADFSSPVIPAVSHFRYRAEEAPYLGSPSLDIGYIDVFYRAFLKMPAGKKLKAGKNYQAAINAAVVTSPPLNFKFDTTKTNWVIHTNQVGYRPGHVKTAYMDMWTGKGTVSFSGYSIFHIINEVTSQTVFTGNVVLSSANNRWTFSDIYSMDFSSFQAPGTYHLYVPGVGISYPFKIDDDIYRDVIGYTAMRGMLSQRDGNHGLDDVNITHWNRPPAHLDDAIDEASGQPVDLVGGHMDAGDRGKYPYNVALVCATYLTAARLFPGKIYTMAESLELPESGNGIPDLLDEAAYELDMLYKFCNNTSTDGCLANYLRPANGGYEDWDPPQGQAGRKFFNQTSGPNIAETLLSAGALAEAYNNPMMQLFFPAQCTNYLIAAERAYNGFKIRQVAGTIAENTAYDVQKGGCPHTWSDEMLYCAANLLQATGDSAEYAHWLNDEMPLNPTNYNSFKRWSWDMGGPWPHVFLSIYYNTHSAVTQAKKTWAYNGILDHATSEMNHETPFGAPTQDEGYPNAIGWHFVWGKMIPVLIGYGVTGNTTYFDRIQRTWNYVLGANAPGKPFITGLGDAQREYRWFVHEIWRVEYSYYLNSTGGWSEPPPGIPIADLQPYGWPWWYNDAHNSTAKNEVAPLPHAVMYSFTDCWKVENEYVSPVMAAQAFAVLPMLPDSLLTVVPHNGQHPGLHVYPNPSDGEYLQMVLSPGFNARTSVKIFNLNGQLIYQKSSVGNIISIHFETRLPAGMYFIGLANGEQTFNKKLLVVE